MRIVTARRISQVFFLALFLWFCVAATLGDGWWRLAGWPVNWLLELDPLLALGVMLATGTLYAGLLWALVTVALTLVLGRAWCSWICPFGAMHHFLGWLALRAKRPAQRMALNQPQSGRKIKYYLLAFVLAASAGGLLQRGLSSAATGSGLFWLIAAGAAATVLALAMLRIISRPAIALAWTGGLMAVCFAAGRWLGLDQAVAASLQSGLLDPLPLVYRSINLALLPLADAGAHFTAAQPRLYIGAWLIGAVFLAALALNFWRPRFYCRFICPLGALLGLLGRFAIWRVGKAEAECKACGLCQQHCQGACRPADRLGHSECVLCLNCLDSCEHEMIAFSTRVSAGGEDPLPDLTRRGVLVSLVSGLATAPLLRAGGSLAGGYNPEVVRPPGALPEAEFLSRCTKCGQCMRVCPTNVIHPAGLEAGLEGLWTPKLDFRIGTSGCQFTCVACGNLCPTAAIRPLSLAQRMGTGDFAAQGPIRVGTAFIERGRCLPWAMDRPCIVCQENCPVSPKAIHTQVVYSPVRFGRHQARAEGTFVVRLTGERLPAAPLASGDYYCRPTAGPGASRRRIIAADGPALTLAPKPAWPEDPATNEVMIEVRLQRPVMDPVRCIGCGVCQHECPVSGRPAIRVTAENETRAGKPAFL